MTTAPPRQATLSPRVPVPPGLPPFSLRPARPEDAAALAALSRPFVRTGALRERPLSLYADRAADFLVVETAGGALDACVGLRTHPAGAGVLYNFCVAGRRQGCGMGAGLLTAALARARNESLRTLFTATTGGGRLFLRHGFTPARTALAPVAWTRSLDPRRNALILSRAVRPDS
ncbi:MULTISPECIES: GNAT family N-acetyltransferase [unclassified Streptomyces]|uniref:GNAT family N-acetyltransferase n=1 Tax=Streptomyces sp. NPDC127129 TaxID=3345373 RepID=UPI003644891C